MPDPSALQSRRRWAWRSNVISALWVVAALGLAVDAAGGRVPRDRSAALMLFGCVGFVIVFNGHRIWRQVRSR